MSSDLMGEEVADYRQLFIDDVPMMDVRAPVEFARGAFPAATNIPLLDDLQREQVGTRYKQAGQDEAVRLGLELATPEIRQHRLDKWLKFCRSHPDGVLYCFRGGLRSQTTQQWISDQGIDYPLVRGGYKAMRRYLIDELENSVQQIPLICVSGLTGVGKTRLLLKLAHYVDFEGLANHRGSAFGRDPFDHQPMVIDWENAVSIEFIKHRAKQTGGPVFVEDESRRIGRVNMPENLYGALLKAPRAILQLAMDERVELIREDYITRNWPTYQHSFPATAETEFSRFVLDNLVRIQRRLGGDHFKQVNHFFKLGLQQLFADGSAKEFDNGIRILLEHYYDPMYRYQIETKKPEIVFEGGEAEFLEWAVTCYGN
jgi:tRNA 2-selenouridine synthase